MDEEQARAYLESIRWPEQGGCCPHCGGSGPRYRLRPGKESSTRQGLWRCGMCRRQFTVTVNTVLEASKLPLTVWIRAVRLLCTRPFGWTVREMARELGISYRPAWALTDRIRYAVTQTPFPGGGDGLLPLRAPGKASLYPLPETQALACLLAVKPEHRHPLAMERREAFLEQRRTRR